ncbi:uncharacterized protein LOC122959047 [Acropora millepora]|uniref:uncharacterized protein LOC122959047 n=1 Tax=Acropora millepora TaxID=45264 RepID=UPI001CF43A88|nr:uncharacterized protein LOC122959047 [Acropora millepora]
MRASRELKRNKDLEGLFLIPGLKRKRRLIEEDFSELLEGISGKPEIREQARRALMELKWYKYFRGIQGDGLNFKASQSSGMHILIILNQERKSQS